MVTFMCMLSKLTYYLYLLLGIKVYIIQFLIQSTYTQRLSFY